MTIKDGDWVVYGLKLGQAGPIRHESYGTVTEFSDGFIRTSGKDMHEWMRPLTLRNKVIVQSMDGLYDRLRQIDGESGFNYPDICRYFEALALEAIDGDEKAERAAYDKAQKFIQAAGDYQRVIDGVRLFRPK